MIGQGLAPVRGVSPLKPLPQEAEGPAVAPVRTRALLAGALLGAALLYLAYFPVGWSWLAWVALVPWLMIARQPGRPRRLYLVVWLGGLVFFWPVLQWMRVADYRMYATWGALATYCAAYVPLAFLLIRRFDRGTALPLT